MGARFDVVWPVRCEDAQRVARRVAGGAAADRAGKPVDVKPRAAAASKRVWEQSERDGGLFFCGTVTEGLG
jgi:hypothetical protein